MKTGQINAIKCISHNMIIKGIANIFINRLNIKNKLSKFLIISLTGNVLVVDLHCLSSISLIPKCFALPTPLLYLSKNIDVV